MKTIPILVILLAVVLAGCGRSDSDTTKAAPPPQQAPKNEDGRERRFPAQLLAFSAAREREARQLAADFSIQAAPEIWAYFKCAIEGDFQEMTNVYERLRLRAGQYEGSANDPTVSSLVWQTIIEVQTAYNAFASGGRKYPLAFGEGIIQSIPPGSIYFGGTDPGRGLVSALCESLEQAKPFYIMTQNALVDNRYLDYLRWMYGKKIYIPTTNDLQTAMMEYMEDMGHRLEHDQRFPGEPNLVKPGENVHKTEDGQVQVNGQVAVMAINGLLVKSIFNQNTNCEFFVEESFPLDWMYPYLSPHGLIFKLNRTPLPALTVEMMDEDRAFWSKQCGSMLGGWLTPETSISNVCAFVDSVYGRKDLSHFNGDPGFVTNDFATKSFSKLRSSIADLYQWRLSSKTDAGDKARLRAETDYACRQAFAMCPTNPEAIYRYVTFLVNEQRLDDVMLLVRTARTLDPDDAQLATWSSQLTKAIADKPLPASTNGAKATSVPSQPTPPPASTKKFEDMTAMEVAQDPAAYGFEKGGDMVDGVMSGTDAHFGDQSWIRGINKQWTKKTPDGKAYILTIHYENDKIQAAKWGGF